MSPLGHITRNRGEVRGVLLWLLYVFFEKIATIFGENFATVGNILLRGHINQANCAMYTVFTHFA